MLSMGSGLVLIVLHLQGLVVDLMQHAAWHCNDRYFCCWDSETRKLNGYPLGASDQSRSD